MKNDSIQRKLIVFGFLAIPVTLLLTFVYFAAARLVQFSFTDWNGISKKMNYIGFANYVEVLSNPEYLKIFLHNIAYLVCSIVQNIELHSVFYNSLSYKGK